MLRLLQSLSQQLQRRLATLGSINSLKTLDMVRQLELVYEESRR